MRHPPTNDRLISTLDEHSNSRYEEPQVRIDRYTHPEFPAINETNVKEYIRAKTKWNAYSFNAQSFVDLVTEDFVPEGKWRPVQRIRLRIVSRQELCPMIWADRPGLSQTLIIRPRTRSREGEEIEDGEELSHRARSTSGHRITPLRNFMTCFAPRVAPERSRPSWEMKGSSIWLDRQILTPRNGHSYLYASTRPLDSMG